MDSHEIEQAHGHFLLSEMGKRVLRPGGKELTRKLVSGLQITSEDRVIELAPGMGWTALQVLQKHLASYVGVELDEETVRLLKRRLAQYQPEIIQGYASKVDLPDASADKLFGEAMLTMHADQRKSRIIREAYRLLKKGGFYGVHELLLAPETLTEEKKREIQRELAKISHVNARPLTQPEWIALFEKEGFKVKKVMTNKMSLLEPKRIVNDEGFFHTLKIGFNIYTHPKIKQRVLAMKKVFKKYREEMHAIALVVEKS